MRSRAGVREKAPGPPTAAGLGPWIEVRFDSFYSAGLILTAVVMSTIGVFIGLLVTGQPFGIVMGGIGVIALAGIVVNNNNIVLIDTYDRLREAGHPPLEAVMQTGAQRLRPVMLTTITTMLGLMLKANGAAWRRRRRARPLEPAEVREAAE
jgi:multidrug efflux pump subunit AcrB